MAIEREKAIEVSEKLADLMRKSADPAWLVFETRGKQLIKARLGELGEIYGHQLSTAVCGSIKSQVQIRVDAEYWRLRGNAEGRPDLVKMAAYLINISQRLGKDALEFARTEAADRDRKAAPAPWEGIETEGEENDAVYGWLANKLFEIDGVVDVTELPDPKFTGEDSS